MSGVRELRMVEAVREALRDAMREDERVLLLGQDVGRNGGVFRATEGLLDEFGPQRVVDVPISEASMAGWGVGMAASGLRPVVEYQFSGFMYPALDQVVDHAARLRWRSRGRLRVPLVLRAPCGAGVHAPENHSEAPEAYWAHVPGFAVLVPCTPQSAYDALRWAISSDDPALVLEPKRLYRADPEPVERRPPGAEPPGPVVLHEGDDATVVTWGASVVECGEAARVLAREGIRVHLLALVTLRPRRLRPVLESVRRTGRLVIVHEACRTGGFGAEVAATVAELAAEWLAAPVRRVTGRDAPVPLPRHEWAQIPSAERIASAVRTLVREWPE